MDLRLKQNRREAFVQWMVWSIENYDCDPSIFMANYLFDRFEHNQEQKLWICWLYGTNYYFPTTWVVWNEFPDFELVDEERLTGWNSNHYKKLRYQTDTKYNKGHLPAQFASYRNWVGRRSQRHAMASFYGDNEKQTYQNLTDQAYKHFYKFGRYSTWFYLQALRHCAGVPLEPKDLLLSDYSGSRSHRNGLLLALGKDEKIDEKLTAGEYTGLESIAAEILEQVRELVSPDKRSMVDFFAMETCLCSFKKIFRVKRGRYLGYYLDRQAEEIQRVQDDGWDGINWKPLWQARSETIQDRSLLGGYIQEEKMSHFLETGQIHPSTFKTASTLEGMFE